MRSPDIPEELIPLLPAFSAIKRANPNLAPYSVFLRARLEYANRNLLRKDERDYIEKMIRLVELNPPPEGGQEGQTSSASSGSLERKGKVIRCYEFFVLEETCRDANTGKKLSSRLCMEIDPQEEGIIDEVLQKHGRNSWEFFHNCDVTFRRDGVWPWAIVLFNEEFRLAGHVLSIRQNKRDFLFTAYSIKPGAKPITEQEVPSVSVILVYEKKALERAATQSKLFSAAWEQLADRSEDQHWICIADSPPAEWMRQTSQDDDELFSLVSGSLNYTAGQHEQRDDKKLSVLVVEDD
jgi:hypothetical protein